MIVTVLLLNLVVYSTVLLLFVLCHSIANRLIDTVWKVGRYWSDIQYHVCSLQSE